MKKLALAAVVATFVASPAVAGEVVGTPGSMSLKEFYGQMKEDWEGLKREAPQSYYTEESYEVAGPNNDSGVVGEPKWRVIWRDIPDNVGVDRGDNGDAGNGGGAGGSSGGNGSGSGGNGDGGNDPGGDCPGGGPGNGNGNSPNSGNGGGNTNGSGPGTGNNGSNNGRGNGAGGGGGGSGNGGR